MQPTGLTGLASVKRNPSEKETEQNFTRTTRKFRDVIAKFKNQVYENLESGKGLDKHNIERLDDAVNKIIQLGNILDLYLLPKKSLDDTDEATRESVNSVKDVFASNGVDLDNLDDEERGQCFYIVKTDIQWFPYAIGPNHIQSLEES